MSAAEILKMKLWHDEVSQLNFQMLTIKQWNNVILQFYKLFKVVGFFNRYLLPSHYDYFY